MTIGTRIKQLREANNLTQEELGAAINTKKQTIFKYETGIITNIPMDKIVLIAKKLNCDPAYLMGWSDDPTLNKDNSTKKDSNEAIDSQSGNIVIPEKYKDLMVAFEGGAEDLTQEDIQSVINFVEFLKQQKKK